MLANQSSQIYNVYKKHKYMTCRAYLNHLLNKMQASNPHGTTTTTKISIQLKKVESTKFLDFGDIFNKIYFSAAEAIETWTPLV